jgi:hypothetical protein
VGQLRHLAGRQRRTILLPLSQWILKAQEPSRFAPSCVPDSIASGPAGDRCAFVPVHSYLSRTYKTDAVREKLSRRRMGARLANVPQCLIGNASIGSEALKNSSVAGFNRLSDDCQVS